jgi:Ca-activated chloride channel homolog
MKMLKHIVWVIVAFALSGCEPSTQVTAAQQKPAAAPKAVPSKHTTEPELRVNIPPPPAWFGDGKGVTVVDDLTKKNFYVVLDGSGSMNESIGREVKIVSAKAAVKRFASKVPADANLGLLAFDGKGTSERVPLGTGNRPFFHQKVDEVDTRSGTPLRSAITKAYEHIKAQAAKQLGYGEYHLVIVTDGEAEAGEDPRSIVNDILARSPVVIHTIGFGIGEGHSLNQKGRVFYKAANDAKALERGLEGVLAEADSFSR